MKKSSAISQPHLDEILVRALDHLGDMVEVTDPEGRFQFVNQAFERVTGYTREQVIGRTPRELLRGTAHPTEFYDEIWDTITGGRVWTGRLVSRGKHGRPVIQEAVISPVKDDRGVITNFVAVKRDLTERDRMQAQLIQSDRLAAVGQLAAGIAHEVNNPLSYVIVSLEIIEQRLEHIEDDELKGELAALVTDATHGATRIRDIVRQLNTFSQPDTSVAEVDAVEVVKDTVRVLRNVLSHRAQVQERYANEAPVLANRAALGQVFLALLMNAAQSIEEGGPAENVIRVEVRCEGDAAFVSVQDSGVGMDAETADHAFDPFFTTKPVGEGTGLGLTVGRNLVERMGGEIDLETRLGEGSTFRVRLPLLAIPAEAVGRPQPGAASSAPLRVLLVEDDDVVRRAFMRMLDRHDVVACASGTDALAAVADGEFDVVVCDLMVPDLSGPEIYARIEKDRPELAARTLFVTGGAFTAEAAAFRAQLGDRILDKPVRQQDLEEAVARLANPRD